MVLALDRLTDVQASRVVAPVAETAAQALAVMAGGQWSAIAADVAAALLSMLRLPDSIWQVRHGGLLGLKYLAAAAPALFCPRSLEESGALGSEIPVRGAGEAGGGSGREGTPGDGQAGGVGSAGVGAAALEALVGVLECGSDVCQAVAAQCLSPLKALLLERGSEQMLQRAVSAVSPVVARVQCFAMCPLLRALRAP